ncbi:aspartyl protease family protein [Burkholderia sp. FERM BP-3421]|uniref:aspartyl protease family protein n=1 Tax=Burkholderia sp. FERM BP-3421 TaxID=1494466 RepID=UPI0023607535|nr:aspartyl protease family protein [Burkholderia sp. FERM BP-3421]WDD92595.1 aspartyl protease family protein [Burkholderia sp. FERM BP-3421]
MSSPGDIPSSSNGLTDCRPFLIEGTARSKGLVGKFFAAVDPRRHIATLQVTDTGPADFSFGVSGARAWVKDAGGIVSDADFAGYREGIVSDAYWLSGGIANKCWPASIRSSGTEPLHGTPADTLRVSPQGGKATTAWISRVTHLPLRWSRRDEPDVASTTYSDYRRVGDRVIPFRQRIVDRDGNQWDLRAVRVRTGAASDRVDERAQKPASTSSDHWIDGGDTTTIPMDGSGKPRVNVFINGKGPFSFLFDSGGALMMSRAAADAAGLKLFGKGQETGITGAATTIRFAKIGDLRIGSAHLRDQFVSIRDGASNGVAPQDAGLIGYEVLARFTTTFDFPNRTISLSLQPGEATAGGSAASVIALDHTVPVVEGAMNGVADYFWLDTGFNGALLVNRTFGIAHPTAMPERLYDIGGSLSAVGGGSTIQAGRISSVTIGTVTFADVIGMFSSVDSGLNTDSEFAADVGDALLGSCAVTFDYKARRLWIAQSDVSGRPLPSAYNRAGFGIEYANSGVANVSYVRESSPAAEVGLREGDRVIGINGREVSGAVVLAIKSRLRTRDDAPIRLTVLRAGSVLELAVQPRDYVQ